MIYRGRQYWAAADLRLCLQQQEPTLCQRRQPPLAPAAGHLSAAWFLRRSPIPLHFCTAVTDRRCVNSKSYCFHSWGMNRVLREPCAERSGALKHMPSCLRCAQQQDQPPRRACFGAELVWLPRLDSREASAAWETLTPSMAGALEGLLTHRGKECQGSAEQPRLERHGGLRIQSRRSCCVAA